MDRKTIEEIFESLPPFAAGCHRAGCGEFATHWDLAMMLPSRTVNVELTCAAHSHETSRSLTP